MKGFTFLTDPIFSDGSDFSKGYAEVTYTNYITGMEDLKTGKSIDYFLCHNGELLEKDKTDISDIPRQIVDKKQVLLQPFKNSNGLWGYLDQSKEIAISPQFLDAKPFVNGFARVASKEDYIYSAGYLKTWGLIDQNGNVVAPLEFNELSDVHNNVVMYKKIVGFDWVYQSPLGRFKERYEGVPLYGYLIYSDLEKALSEMNEQLNRLNTELEKQTRRGQIEAAQEKIKRCKEKISTIKKLMPE